MGLMPSSTSIMVERPVQEVWEFLTDPLNLPRWSDAWLEARLRLAGPIRKGATFRGRKAVIGVDLWWTGVVTEWDPPRAFAYSVKFVGARSYGRLVLSPTAAGTKVERTSTREARPIQVLASWFLRPWLSHHHEARNLRLESLLEEWIQDTSQ